MNNTNHKKRAIGFFTDFCRQIINNVKNYYSAGIYFGRHMSRVPDDSIVVFPINPSVLSCGISAIIAVNKKKRTGSDIDTKLIEDAVTEIDASGYDAANKSNVVFNETYLGGEKVLSLLYEYVCKLKKESVFSSLIENNKVKDELKALASRISGLIHREDTLLSQNMGHLGNKDIAVASKRMENLKDIGWSLDVEVLGNIEKVSELIDISKKESSVEKHAIHMGFFKRINTVLNSIDRLEVRGRDSAGISLMFVLEKEEFKKFEAKVILEQLEDTEDTFDTRTQGTILVNGNISVGEPREEDGKSLIPLTFTYKVASEIGSLGDNVAFLREQIKNDAILQNLCMFPATYFSVSAHTRWASVGEISEPNCHPVDNFTSGSKRGIIHICLNGDIDNYQALKNALEEDGITIDGSISTDTKIIPLQIEKYIREGNTIEDAFRMSVNDFEGSHAISMHTDLAPGKLFLAQRGSGQALFVGMAEEYYIVASEVYGFVEETPFFIKLEGEKVVEGKNGKVQGQILIADQMSKGGLAGIRSYYYDGTPVELGEKDIQHTGITSRDIDRQNFPHYFLKEITESPVSVKKTLQGRWKTDDKSGLHDIILDETVIPENVKDAVTSGKIKKIFVVGQGTAGVAAQACADIINFYMNDSSFVAGALKASEMSGFKLGNSDCNNSMTDTLMIAISQSGTTTDTNRTVDMVRERGGLTIAIVNRRDSDITFKADGVIYTSSGRDIEMSVASTKAFYSQIVAGAILGLYLAKLKGRRNAGFVSDEIATLLRLPEQMTEVFSLKPEIKASAEKLALSRTYWATVGSGPNKASADEIRIKLSELCYKTISSDFVEDKKHIDLSSEPLIIVCAAGTRGNVIGDIVKDAAIFKAHKAIPIVIADEGEHRFDPYAEDIFRVPVTSEHLAPVLNTLVGHIWGYYAALAINDGSGFLFNAREEIKEIVDDYSVQGLDIYEVILEKRFRESIFEFYKSFRKKKAEKQFPEVMGIHAASDLTLLLKYLSGRLPLSDFELDFNRKGTARNMLDTLFERLGEMINCMARPVDAIKHQAKTVTVGTSRIAERIEGILFDTLESYDIGIPRLTNSNVIVLKNLQRIVSGIEGAIYYRIDKLNALGEPDQDTTIEIIRKEGVLKPIPSRVEKDNQLKGTKRIIIRQGNVYIGKGRKDDRSIIIIPVISDSASGPSYIDNMLLLNISFKEDIDLEVKIKALGGKYEHIKNIVNENNVPWDDSFLELIEIKELFGRSAEKVGEQIVNKMP
jgi:glutamine---fructose-6-phosphate transaminase (isomerizing)